MEKYNPAFQRHRMNGTVIVAVWVLGIAALLEVIFASVALAPHLLSAVRNGAASAPSLSGTTAIPSASPSSPAIRPLPTPVPESVLTGAVQDQTNSSTEIPAPSPGTETSLQEEHTLGIVSTKLEGKDGESQKLIIAMKAPPDSEIDDAQVKVQVYFYDTDGGEITPSKAQVTSNWMSLPVTWQKHGEPELLEVNYLPDTTDPDIKFAGYVVAIYYKGELQDYRAEPSQLAKLFPLKYFIGTDE